MTKPKVPAAVRKARPFKFRVVGGESRLPRPVTLTITSSGMYRLDIVTQAEHDALPPSDEPGTFSMVRPGIYARVRWTAEVEGAPVKPEWMD